MSYVDKESEELPINHVLGIGALACAGIIGLSLLVGTWLFGNPLKPVPNSSIQHPAKAGIKIR